jgi:cytochrome c553
MKKLILLIFLATIAAGAVRAAPSAPKVEGAEDKSYKWNAQVGETMAALSKKGDRKRGKEAYETCGVCHLPNAAGRPDGVFPQLAGQHTTVLIKQIADIRAGLRDNPTMYPFAMALSDAQELADVSAYIESLCIPLDHGKYDSKPGDTAGKNWKSPADTAQRLLEGKALYEKECKSCHGADGEGDKEKFYPLIAGQHYKYLLRQMLDIRDGRRRNANLDMVKVIKKYDNEQLISISAFQASLVAPANTCKPKAAVGKNQ